MTDRKFSLLRKEQQWVLCCGKDIIWLVGERTDNRFRIDSSTQRVLIIHIIKKNGNSYSLYSKHEKTFVP